MTISIPQSLIIELKRHGFFERFSAELHAAVDKLVDNARAEVAEAGRQRHTVEARNPLPAEPTSAVDLAVLVVGRRPRLPENADVAWPGNSTVAFVPPARLTKSLMSSLASAAAERHVVLVKAKELLDLSSVLPDDYELRTVVAGMPRPLLWALYRAAVSPKASDVLAMSPLDASRAAPEVRSVLDPQCISQRDGLRKQYPAHVFLSRLVKGYAIDPDTAWSASHGPARVQGEETARAILRLLRAKAATEPQTVGGPRKAAEGAERAAVLGQEAGQ